MTEFDYTEFLLDRLREVEAEVVPHDYNYGEWESSYILADAKAKYSIVGQLKSVREVLGWLSDDHFQRPWYELAEMELEEVVEALCYPFADHPEFPGNPNE